MSFEFTAQRWAWPGQAMGFHEGKAVFVGAVLPGETVLIEPVKTGKKHMEARLIQVIDPSEQRIEPACPHFPTCGGCGLLHLSYEDQLALKKDQMKEQLQRQKIDVEPEIVASPQVWFYRHKASLKPIGGQIGLNRYRSSQVLPIPHCKVLSEGIKKSITELPGVAEKLGDLMAIESHRSGQIALVWNQKNRQKPQPGFGQQVSENYGFGDVSLDAGLFAQSNPAVVSLILKAIQEATEGYDSICEHYAGSGTISHVVAPMAKEYHGFEASVKAAKRGNQNLERLAVGSGTIKAQKAEQATLPREAQLLVVDPPRSGMATELIETTCRSNVDQIIYLSCDLQTQVRDLGKLKAQGGFQVQKITSFDMYAHTGHQESLAILNR